MDIATLLGIFFGIVFTVISITMGGKLFDFYDKPSIMITIGGGIAATLISYRMSELGKILKVVAKAFVGKPMNPIATIVQLVDLSNKARREGLLSLEAEQENIKDPFIRQAIDLIVVGVEPDLIRETMDLELDNLQSRHEKGQGLFKTLAAQFPAWGMIGTLIGLIQLLKQLNDPSSIGPAMAVALITTFYGSMLANFVCNPIANKLAIKSKEEVQIKEMIIEGILSIQAGENPRIMEYKLTTFLSPDQKQEYARHSEENTAKRKEDSETIAS